MSVCVNWLYYIIEGLQFKKRLSQNEMRLVHFKLDMKMENYYICARSSLALKHGYTILKYILAFCFLIAI